MADDTRERVLRAAGPVFAAKGYDAATVREICASADVNLASVNYHFGNKETLYLETVRTAHQEIQLSVPMPEMAVDSTPADKLHSFVCTLLTRLLGGGESGGAGWQTELLIREMIHPTHACRSLVEDYIRPHFEQLLSIIDEFVPSATPVTLRQQIAFSIVGQCLHYRVAEGFISLLTELSDRESLLDIDVLAEQITQFSISGLSGWPSTSASDTTSRVRQSLS